MARIKCYFIHVILKKYSIISRERYPMKKMFVLAFHHIREKIIYQLPHVYFYLCQLYILSVTYIYIYINDSVSIN